MWQLTATRFVTTYKRWAQSIVSKCELHNDVNSILFRLIFVYTNENNLNFVFNSWYITVATEFFLVFFYILLLIVVASLGDLTDPISGKAIWMGALRFLSCSGLGSCDD